MAGGQAKTEYRLDDGPWVAGAALTVPALTDHSSDGVHRVGYRSTDAAGNTEAAKSLTVQIDTTGPATAARKATGRRGGGSPTRLPGDRRPELHTEPCGSRSEPSTEGW